MKGTTIHLDRLRGRLAAARLVDGRLDDLLVEGDPDLPVPGAVYRATVDRQMKGQGGVTLRLPEGVAYLRKAKRLRVGERLLVQVTGYAEEGKAVPVSVDPILKSRHVIVTPGKPGINVSRRITDEIERARLLELVAETCGDRSGLGLILRSAAAGAGAEEVAGDIMATTDLAEKIVSDQGTDPELLAEGPDPHMLAWRDWSLPDELFTEPGNFAAHDIEEKVTALTSGRVELGSGHWFSVEPTQAFVAVDVNTGTDATLAAGLKANIACGRALPAALRCLGLGGQVVIDMAPAPKKDRRMIEQVLKAAFRADPVDTILAGWTPLGHVELQRKRERLPLHRIFGD